MGYQTTQEYYNKTGEELLQTDSKQWTVEEALLDVEGDYVKFCDNETELAEFMESDFIRKRKDLYMVKVILLTVNDRIAVVLVK